MTAGPASAATRADPDDAADDDAGGEAPPATPAALREQIADARAKWASKPGRPAAAFAVARALAALGDGEGLIAWADEIAAYPMWADRVLAIGRKLLPEDLALAEAWCRFPERAGDWRAAGLRWYVARGKFPRQPGVHLGFINALLKLDRIEEAARGIESAQRVIGRKPELTAMAERVAAQLAAQTAAAVPAPVIAPTTEPAEILRKRLMTFENFGRNCEFGLLQRDFGAEPLGLLRFSTTRVRTLLILLRSRFEGMGVPEAHAVDLVENEWRLRHKASGWRTHTRVMGHQQPDGDVVLTEKCRHAAFLTRKLIKDLETSAKIIVYQSGELDDAEAIAIHDALQAYGPNLLLAVRLGSRQHPPGTVIFPKPTLMLAHIDRQGKQFSGAGWDISRDYWLHFCAIAERHKAELGLGAGGSDAP